MAVNHAKAKGFTLIELMIVVAIIGILSAIAIPDFMKFTAKSKQAEARMNLGEIYICQISYFSIAGTFAGSDNADGDDAFEQIGYEPKSQQNLRYTYLLDDALLEAPHPPASLPGTLQSTSTGFTAIAAGNIDNDPYVDVWAINDARDLQNRIPSADSWGDYASDVEN